MNRDIATAWIADLRTPGLAQAEGYLMLENGAACCLGRLCLLLGMARHLDGDEGYYRFSASTCTLPIAAMTMAGLWCDFGAPRDERKITVAGKEYDSLSDANDAGRTFAEIADAIEANWERL